ncbi:MAG: transcriptional regulator [Nostoc sp. ChiSLP02]|nr:transcriptional regulator [Nostoc sp. DedSLP05]MDZ8102409.1 transcriptional regulator [Nostoc sp. DedSLP01]MDZ8187793.1 transcriptional regulator [Nostoc sp. ChiSLP02]
MSRKKESITLSIPSGTKEKLEDIARKLRIFWGKSPSVSGLLVAIAQQEFEVGEPFTLNSTQVAALQQAIGLLKDSGFIEQAQTISSLLLERGQLEPPMRQSLLQQVSQPTEAWRILADQFRQNQQPFHLLYANPQLGDLSFTVRYAEIAFEEKRFYLNIWCDEDDTEDVANTDFPQLRHNRCLRLDRIKGVVPINGHWRHEGLDYLKVYLHFYKGLIKAYEPKPNDISNEVNGEVRQVVRRVSNPFWLIREVLRYGDDCVIVAPENVQALMVRKLKTLCQHYKLEVSL